MTRCKQNIRAGPRCSSTTGTDKTTKADAGEPGPNAERDATAYSTSYSRTPSHPRRSRRSALGSPPPLWYTRKPAEAIIAPVSVNGVNAILRRGEGVAMTTKDKPLVIVTRKLPDCVETRMRELFDAELNLDDTPMTPETAGRGASRRADVLVPTITDKIDAELIEAGGPQLKLIANFGVGVDHIDVEPRRAPRHHRHQHAGRAHRRHRRHDHGADPGRAAPDRRGRSAVHRAASSPAGRRPGCWAGASPASGSGIIGMGRIGPAVARRAKAFGLQIHYHNRKPVSAAGRRGAGGDLLGKPRPDAGADGHRLGQLPAHAGDLSPAVGAAARS